MARVLRLLLGASAAAAVHATPPGSPLSDLRPRQLSLGVYFDHGGQLLYEEGSASVYNTVGAALEYGFIPYVQVGLFAGAAELDVDTPPGNTDSTIRAFNSGFGPYWGLSAKLSSPRFLSRTSRFVAYGQGAYVNASDDGGNEKSGLIYNAGLTFQSELKKQFNLVLGVEFYAIDGNQKNTQGMKRPMGLNRPTGVVDLMRGVVGFEYFFKGPNRPFISIAFRPTGAMGYKKDFGLQGGSVSITLGAINSFGKNDQPVDEDSRTIGD